MRITADMARSWEPCAEWDTDRLAEAYGEDGLTPLEVAETNERTDDRLWVLVREDVLGAEGLREVFDTALAWTLERIPREVAVPEGLVEADIKDVPAAAEDARCVLWAVLWAREGRHAAALNALARAYAFAETRGLDPESAEWKQAREQARAEQLAIVVQHLQAEG